MTKPFTPGVTGVILAGGQGRRMGGKDKGLIEVNDSPLIEHVITAIAPQVDELFINANRNIAKYKEFGYPVIEDELPDFQGPLAGMLAGLRRAKNTDVVFVPCDTVSIPHDLVERLQNARTRERSKVCVAHDGQRLHGVYALIDKGCIDSLYEYLMAGNRKVEAWLKTRKFSVADYSDAPQCFVNINTPDDLE